MKKLQMIAVLILSLFFVISCVSDDDEFWDEDLTDTMSGDNSGGNADTSTDTLPDNQQADTGTTDNDTTPAPDNDTTPAPDNDTTPAPDNDTETPDSDTTPAPDNDTTPAPDNDTETPDSDTTPAPDNDTETPDSDTTPAQTEEEKCQTAGGTYANNTCTKTAECTGEKPENTVWNDGDAEDGKFTQTLEGTTWTPATKEATYDENAGECNYKCADSYFRKDQACVTPCEPDPCPDKGGVENSCTATGVETFYCECETGSHWENECAPNTKTVNCTLPAHAHWNEGVETTVVQEWNEGWTPSEEGVYDPEGTDRCSFSCDDDYPSWVKIKELGKCLPECSSTSGTPCLDSTYKLIWSSATSSNDTWENAKKRCADLEEGGYEKGTWELPTISKLRTLILNCEYTQPGGQCGLVSDSDTPCLEDSCNNSTYCNPNTKCKATNGPHSVFEETVTLWSISLRNGDGSSYAWYVNFNNGILGYYSKTSKNAKVRCVIPYTPDDNGTDDPGDGNDDPNP